MASHFTIPPKPEPKSSGSQCSVSATGDVTVPNPTPLTEAMENEAVDPPPDIDFHAMVKILAPIAESLNEAAEDAMYPTPPINTPAVTSPATSVVYRYSSTRTRGLSTIADRLARAKLEGHRFGADTEMMSVSNRSLRSSVPADDESDSLSDLLNDGGKHDIPIFLGSPRPNPMGLISFSANDLANRPPVPFNSTDIIESTSTTVAIGSGSHHPDSARSFATGVTEMSTWKEEVEGRFERALQCLENLAYDEHQLDPSKPMEYYYEAHLRRLMGDVKRKVPVSVTLAVGKTD